ncbi:MAG: hypothetical protein ACR2PS_11260 [Pseudomonadales bacterium]
MKTELITKTLVTLVGAIIILASVRALAFQPAPDLHTQMMGCNAERVVFTVQA